MKTVVGLKSLRWISHLLIICSLLDICVVALRQSSHSENCRTFGECGSSLENFGPEALFSEDSKEDGVDNHVVLKLSHESRSSPLKHANGGSDIAWALERVSLLFNETEPLIVENMSPVEKVRQAPSNFWAAHTLSSSEARERSFPAFVALLATKKIVTRTGVVPNELNPQLEAICPRDTVQFCENRKYRPVDGSCNNVANPMWGATLAPLQRYLDAEYGDGVSSLRASGVPNRELPNVRSLSLAFFREPESSQKQLTALTTHFGHFVYVDLVHLASAQLSLEGSQVPLPCCRSQDELRHPECASIKVPLNDPKLSGFVDCMPYARTVLAAREGCPLGPREQANSATGFLDGSAIYGSTVQKSKELRTLRDGQLLTSSKGTFDEVFPATVDPLHSAFSTVCAPGATGNCFVSGSEHVNFLPTTAAMHTVWIRQHNRIANRLLSLNKKWTDEQIYQETRRIVIAQLQHVTYNEWLPVIVGRESWKRYGLSPKEAYSDPDPYSLSVDPSALNVFASVVGQFVFTQFESRITEYSTQGSRSFDRPLGDLFSDPSSLTFPGRMNGLLRYLIREAPPKVGLHMSAELRERLFKNHGNFGLDLAALILQTGRDHGIPGYTAWREKCGGSRITNFDDLYADIQNSDSVIPILKRAYAAVEDVDLFLLGLAEKPVRGALVGPTFACLLSLQFRKTKKGDRFWFENKLGPYAFTEDQQAEIKKTSFARILCDATSLGSVQPRVFEAPDLYDNFPISCNSSMLADPDIERFWLDADPHIEMPVTMATIRKAIKLGALEVEERRRRETRNIEKFQGKFRAGDPLLSYGKMMRAKREAIEVARMSDVLLQSTKLLLSGHPELIDSKMPLPLRLDGTTLQRLLPDIDVSSFVNNFTAFLGADGSVEKCLPRDLPCDHTTPYRTFNGWCNNLRFPHFGNSFGPLMHLLPPVYEDGIDAPRSIAHNGLPLPSPRLISNAVHLDLPFDHGKFTHMVMQFGQLLDHEMTHSPVERGPNDEILNCTRCDSAETLSVHCMPLPVPVGDPHFPTHDETGERRCLPFARSLLGQLNLGYRNQINQLTAFLDGSAFYGSTKCEADELRLFDGGLLNFTDLGEVNRQALPQGSQEQDCRSAPKHPCFVAGDERNSHQPGLTTMHTMFLREHNRIARQLAALNPFWSDEKLFLETRRIVGAIFQHIVYSEYVPKLVGKDLVAKYGLAPRSHGYFRDYDAACDASISHPFATAAFRFGHTLIRRMFPRLNSFYRNHSAPVDLADNFNNVEAVYDKEAGGIDSILLGLLGTPSMAFDRHITSAVRNHLFGRRGQPYSGMDLITINILRARDHGVQPYNAFREYCGLGRAHSFADLASIMEPTSVAALESVYHSVDDIDLFPGLLSERPMGGALMPPTMACLISEQFSRLKKCDRFYYENDLAETKFTSEQLAEIRKVKLGSVLCQNSAALIKIQPDVFSMPNELTNAQVPCADFPRMNLDKWMDRGVCFIGNEQVKRGKSIRKSPCVSCTCTAEGAKCKTMLIGNCQNLLKQFLFADIVQDMSCLVQCSKLIRERAGRL